MSADAEQPRFRRADEGQSAEKTFLIACAHRARTSPGALREVGRLFVGRPNASRAAAPETLSARHRVFISALRFIPRAVIVCSCRPIASPHRTPHSTSVTTSPPLDNTIAVSVTTSVTMFDYRAACRSRRLRADHVVVSAVSAPVCVGEDGIASAGCARTANRRSKYPSPCGRPPSLSSDSTASPTYRDHRHRDAVRGPVPVGEGIVDDALVSKRGMIR